jgi:hypothetical protein
MKKLLLGFVIAIAGMMAPLSASAAECTLYEQSHPSFVLDGAHLSTGKCGTCASCHKSAVFVGTPRTCIGCHNGDPVRLTVGRSLSHIPTGLIDCNQCHATTLFTVNFAMNHSSVSGQNCDTCHNGSYTIYNAKTKSATHIATTVDCKNCHTTANWTVSHTQIHLGVTTGCVTCHNGTYAKGKTAYLPGHPVTSDQCETCHSIDAAFKCAQAYDEAMKYMAKVFTKIKAYFA